MDEARSMDTADRFVNCKCVKYLLRVNKIDRAIETAGLFTRVRESIDHTCNFFLFLSLSLLPLPPLSHLLFPSLPLSLLFLPLSLSILLRPLSFIRRVFLHYRRWMICSVCGSRRSWLGPTGGVGSMGRHWSSIMKLIK